MYSRQADRKHVNVDKTKGLNSVSTIEKKKTIEKHKPAKWTVWQVTGGRVLTRRMTMYSVSVGDVLVLLATQKGAETSSSPTLPGERRKACYPLDRCESEATGPSAG